MASSIANLVYKLPHELPNDLRLRILGNKKISVKSQSCVDTQPSAQTPFQKLNVGNSSPKINIKVYKFVSKFLDLSSFTRLLKRKRNSSFTRENQFWSQLRPVSLKLCFFSVCISSKHLSKFYGKQKEKQLLQTSNLIVMSKQYFGYLLKVKT